MDYKDIVQPAAIDFNIIAFAITLSFNRRSTNADSFIRINGEYNRMVAYRQRRFSS
jgi:hypothetical protein